MGTSSCFPCNHSMFDEKIRKINKKSSNNEKLSENYDYYPLIKSLIISFCQIEKFKRFFINKNNFSQKEGYYISNLIGKFIKYYFSNDLKYLDIINDMESKLDLKDKNVIQNSNCGEKLIDIILKELHKELNTKSNSEYTFYKRGNNENFIYKNFLEKFKQQNDSIIKDLFLGIKEMDIYYKCCNFLNNDFYLFKYICFDEKKIKKLNNLIDLINEKEKDEILEKNLCPKCKKEKGTLKKKEIIIYPEILIIIIKNNKLDININSNYIIKTKKYIYNLFCFIVKSKKEKNKFKIYYYLKNLWYIIKSDNDNLNNSKEAEKQFKKKWSKNLYPYILFYQKEIKTNKDKNNKDNNTFENEDYIINQNNDIDRNNYKIFQCNDENDTKTKKNLNENNNKNDIKNNNDNHNDNNNDRNINSFIISEDINNKKTKIEINNDSFKNGDNNQFIPKIDNNNDYIKIENKKNSNIINKTNKDKEKEITLYFIFE